MPGEQGAQEAGEIGATRLAAPSRVDVMLRAIVADLAAAVGTDRLTIGLRPTQAQEHVSRRDRTFGITLPGFSERAAADNRKRFGQLSALGRLRTGNMNIVGIGTKVNSCGGCYIRPRFHYGAPLRRLGCFVLANDPTMLGHARNCVSERGNLTMNERERGYKRR